MSLFEIFILGIGLSMDAFAVAICKGLNMKKFNIRYAVVIAIFFAFFQFAMPVIGFFFCSQFEVYISNFDHWIVFGLLSFIGIKMIFESIREARSNGNSETPVVENKLQKVKKEEKLNIKELFVLAIATSIDALAVGISLAFFDVSIFGAGAVIGVTTLTLSFLGVVLGSLFGEKFKTPAEIFGGVVLVLIGLKILLEHLGVLVL